MRNQLKTASLLALLSAILITISYWIIGGTSGIVTGSAIAAVTNLFSRYQLDKIALAVWYAACSPVISLLKRELKLC